MENVNNSLSNLDNYKIIGKGSSAIIYDLGNETCYKKIYNKNYINEPDEKTIIERIKNLHLYNFCKINDIYYQDNRIIGYTMPKYHNDDLDILSMPKDYILDSYRNLCDDIDKLSDNYICIKDLDIHNVFYSLDGIIIYDYDLYKIVNSKEHARLNNRMKLNCLFNEILSHELTFKYYLDSRIKQDKVNELFNYQTDINVLEDKLTKYNRIIDFIRGNYEKHR